MVATIKSTSGRRANEESLARWQAALERASAERIKVTPSTANVGDQVLASSGSDQTLFYLTDGVRCSCPAGSGGDPVCKHRAAYRQAIGDPTAVPVGEEAVRFRICRSCSGAGEIRSWYTERQFVVDTVQHCWSCGGDGWSRLEPVRIVPFSVNE